MRIAHLGSKGIPSKGGTERVVEAVARRQAAAGHHVTVYGSRLVCSSRRASAACASWRCRHAAHKYLGPVLLQLAGAAHALVVRRLRRGPPARGRERLRRAAAAPALPGRDHQPRARLPAREVERPGQGADPGRGRALGAPRDAARPPVSAVQAAEPSAPLRARGRARSPTASTSDEPVDEEGAERLLAGARPAPAASTCCSRRRAWTRPRAATRCSRRSAGSRSRRRCWWSATSATRPATRSGCGPWPRGLPVTLRAAPRRQAGASSGCCAARACSSSRPRSRRCR